MVSVEQNTLQRVVAERMLELIDVRSPWHRSLWQLGTIHAVLEVLECTQATWEGAIPNDKAMKYLGERCQQQISNDLGAGSSATRQLLQDKIRDLVSKKITQRVLAAEVEELARRANRDYLVRWKEWAEAGSLSQQSVERTARLLVSHFLDDGFHATHIHGWLRSVLANKDTDVLTQILDEGNTMCRQNDSSFEFVVPLQRGSLAHHKDMLEDVLFKGDPTTLVDEYERAEQFMSVAPRGTFTRWVLHESAVIVQQSFSARDPHSAAAKLSEWLQKIEARSQIGSPRPLTFSRIVLDRTNNRIRNLQSHSHGPRVPSLERHGLFAREMDSQLDNALGLLASSRALPQLASVATIWAAVEGLLGHPGAQGVDSADGLAAIVACGFPRAELEDLARRPMVDTPEAAKIGHDIAEAEGSERVRKLLEGLRQQGSKIFVQMKDIAAAERVLQIDNDPEGTIKRVQGYFTDVFRRLYYQRNFVMHAAKFDSISLPSTVRSAPKLVAAGLDRVVHARHVRRPVSPLALSARAGNEIAILGQSGAQDFYRLLK
ncbi:hypothetical protein ASF72_01825 [Arthrobacter sp. Leaf141]|uniref:hypothetical protein n=1 Tax=Arthrobacter sp. Leaf141 TaxID=1736273 RepID=UPI000701D373|nr:hypothetical protein [Arthrobacter sp. Leaf141]KQQ96420.1 hypothetical protein ASF72_01825 [Arthrobacter sp. Leaf141]